MNKGMSFWKTSYAPSKKQGMIIAFILAVIFASVAGWYYFILVPQQKHVLELKNKQIALEQQIKQVASFYEGELNGGSIDRLELLLTEIYKSRLVLKLTGYEEDNFVCKQDSCTFSYLIPPYRIFNIQEKEFWGVRYSSNFSDKGVDFTGIPSKLDDNPILKLYHDSKDINVADCTQVLNYIYSFDSVSDDLNTLSIVKPPSSSVSDVEAKIKKNKKYYGLLFGSWEFKGNDDISQIMSLFDRQAFRDSFIIKSIDFKSKGISVSGGLVCKSGN